mmetsp:Transcript_9771/g.20325  ORF Transcript_9771/g.20325 Transcript_9771/m.20325 type:complete len:385 (-) Transcript_9771:963-2117(-)
MVRPQQSAALPEAATLAAPPHGSLGSTNVTPPAHDGFEATTVGPKLAVPHALHAASLSSLRAAVGRTIPILYLIHAAGWPARSRARCHWAHLEPNSRSHASYAASSLRATVGRTACSARRMSPTPILRTRLASTVFNLGPSSLIGSIAASRASARMSLPEYPSVDCTTSAKSLGRRSCSVCAMRCARSAWREGASGSGTYTRFCILRRTASSNSCGRLVAPMTKMRSPPESTPSNRSKNSVLMRRDASCSDADRAERSESISSMKMIAGCRSRATSNSARMSFSPSPIHLEVTVAALIVKNVHLASVATALASSVFPVPGGPNSSTPRTGARRPVNRSARSAGKITISCRARLGFSRPATSAHLTPSMVPRSTISASTAARYTS